MKGSREVQAGSGKKLGLSHGGPVSEETDLSMLWDTEPIGLECRRLKRCWNEPQVLPQVEYWLGFFVANDKKEL